MSLDLTHAADFDTSVKLALYGITAESGRIPALDAVVERVAGTTDTVKEAYLRLRARRLLWLEADSLPSAWRRLSQGPYPAPSHGGWVEYYANCAWDALGIPAALHRPGWFGPGVSRVSPHSSSTSDRTDRNLRPGFSIASCPRPSGGRLAFT